MKGIGIGMNLIGDNTDLPDNLKAPNPIKPDIAAEAPTTITLPPINDNNKTAKFAIIPLRK